MLFNNDTQFYVQIRVKLSSMKKGWVQWKDNEKTNTNKIKDEN